MVDDAYLEKAMKVMAYGRDHDKKSLSFRAQLLSLTVTEETIKPPRKHGLKDVLGEDTQFKD